MNASDEFERLITEGKIQFKKASIRSLERMGQATVSLFLNPASMKWKLGDVRVGESYCLQIEDDFIGYVDIHPAEEQFLWCTKDHHASIHPDVASSYFLMKAIPGVQARCMVDDITGTRIIEVVSPTGLRVRCKDYEKDGERKIEFESF